MKKILFLFMMFASVLSLYASPPNIENTININAGQENENVSSNGKSVVAAHADKKVIISQKDSLMYSWGEGLDHKIPCIGGGLTANVTRTVAVVCHLRGEGGV